MLKMGVTALNGKAGAQPGKKFGGGTAVAGGMAGPWGRAKTEGGPIKSDKVKPNKHLALPLPSQVTFIHPN